MKAAAKKFMQGQKDYKNVPQGFQQTRAWVDPHGVQHQETVLGRTGRRGLVNGQFTLTVAMTALPLLASAAKHVADRRAAKKENSQPLPQQTAIDQRTAMAEMAHLGIDTDLPRAIGDGGASMGEITPAQLRELVAAGVVEVHGFDPRTGAVVLGPSNAGHMSPQSSAPRPRSAPPASRRAGVHF
ncbi:MAG TPA: hypothetical protein VHU91_09795 [Mycobacteriales bacterium]|jgi:hypothetical protein|nr:hypothetical protein [Mycobacteriales bacterium]